MPPRPPNEVRADPWRRDFLRLYETTEAHIAALRALPPAEALERIEAEFRRQEDWARRRGAFLLEELYGAHGPAVRPTHGRQAAMAPA